VIIDHVAIVVKDLDAAVELYVSVLGFSIAYRETIADQGVEAVGLQAGDSIIELLRPLDASSPVARFRARASSWHITPSPSASPSYAQSLSSALSGIINCVPHSTPLSSPMGRLRSGGPTRKGWPGPATA